MGKIYVAVKNDHLQKLAATKKPILAIAELIWNSLDADATQIEVVLKQNELGGISTIHVIDNGHGIHIDEAKAAFGNLGGSWKYFSEKSKTKGRLLHGRAGKGRFRAFSLGNRVVWNTRFAQNGNINEYAITGASDDLSVFTVTEPVLSLSHHPGTEVVISDIPTPLPSLLDQSAWHELTALFAIYLSQYPDVEILYHDHKLDPRIVQKTSKNLDLGSLDLPSGETAEATITVIEWSTNVERSLFLCDENGFVLNKTQAGIHAPGFLFTAYLKSAYLRELDERNALSLGDLEPDLTVFLEAARKELRNYFREQSANEAAHLVELWKKEAIYPYEGEAANPLEEIERQVFDVLALSVNEYLPEFQESRPEAKRFQFRLLRQALEESPSSVQKIIGEVLDLPESKREELAELLERTSLAAIINASKVVADRLDFLRALEIFLFKYKKHLKERAQLHKLLETNTWVFGERFSLMVSDKSLTEVLKRHITLLGRDDVSPALEPVHVADGGIGIVDMMLSRAMKPAGGKEREHLVVELKRPDRKIDSAAYDQIEKYAFAVAQDERFRDTACQWTFWAVSNDLSDNIRRRARQKDKPQGLLYEASDMPLTIWVKTWGEIITDCRARLQFFQENLEYSPDDESALEKLRTIHKNLLLPSKSQVDGTDG